MVQTGKVLSCDGDLCEVEIIRESACSSCHSRSSCTASAMAGCAKFEKVVVKAKNTVGARCGETVELTSDSAGMLGIAFCVFILPIITAIAAYFTASVITDKVSICYIIATVFFTIAFFGLFFGFDRRLSKSINVEVSSVLEKSN